MSIHDLNYYTIVPDAVLKNDSLTDTDFKTLIVIYSLTRAEGFCSMSNAELSKLLGGIKERALQTRINKLIQQKFIIRVLEEFPWGTARKLYMPETFFANSIRNPESRDSNSSPALSTNQKTIANDFKMFVDHIRNLPFAFSFVSDQLGDENKKYEVRNRKIFDLKANQFISKYDANILWKFLFSNKVRGHVIKKIDAVLEKMGDFQ